MFPIVELYANVLLIRLHRVIFVAVLGWLTTSDANGTGKDMLDMEYSDGAASANGS